MGQHVIAAVPHGFRSSFRDWAGEETDHPREVAETALAHKVRSRVEPARQGSRPEDRSDPMIRHARSGVRWPSRQGYLEGSDPPRGRGRACETRTAPRPNQALGRAGSAGAPSTRRSARGWPKESDARVQHVQPLRQRGLEWVRERRSKVRSISQGESDAAYQQRFIHLWRATLRDYSTIPVGLAPTLGTHAYSDPSG